MDHLDASPAAVAQIAHGWETSPKRAFFDEIKAFSMMHQETLALLHHFAAAGAGNVLEIGAYIGGSTVAISRALPEECRLVTMEAGGSYDHPTLPSADIIEDLRANLRRYGVLDRVEIIQKYSNRAAALRLARRSLARHSVTLFFVDADGGVGRDLWTYEPLLAEGCILVFDDYETGDSKGAQVRPCVERLKRRGVVEDFGVYLWGTWVGRYRRLPAWRRWMWRLRDAPLDLPLLGPALRPTRRFIRNTRRRIKDARSQTSAPRPRP